METAGRAKVIPAHPLPNTMKKQNYTASITLNPFRYEVLVILANNFHAALAKLGLGHEYRDKAGLFIDYNGHGAIVFDTRVLDHGVIAHESAHCIFNALAAVGQDPVSGEETFAYMLQDLVETIHDFCKEKKVKID